MIDATGTYSMSLCCFDNETVRNFTSSAHVMFCFYCRRYQIANKCYVDYDSGCTSGCRAGDSDS